jgi:hypothetical protein
MAKNQEDGSTILLRLEGYVVANHIMGVTHVSQPPHSCVLAQCVNDRAPRKTPSTYCLTLPVM